MEKLNSVSIWIGYFSDKEELKRYVKVNNFDSEDDSTSIFWNDYFLDDIDIDFQEVGWEENAIDIESIIKGASYWKAYIDKIKVEHSNIDISKFNSMILILNYEYLGRIKEASNTKFLGNYEYGG